MLIRYEPATAPTEEIEVDDSIGIFIIDSRRAEDSLDRKERRHCLSLDGMVYEGVEMSEPDFSEERYGTEAARNDRVWEAFSHLSDVQRRRLLMLADGLSIREISRIEGKNYKTVYESIEAGRKKFLQFYETATIKTTPKCPYSEGGKNPTTTKEVSV